MDKLSKLRRIIFIGGILWILAIPSLGYLIGDSKIGGYILIAGWFYLVICVIRYLYYWLLGKDNLNK
jgi:hypothetical protein